MSHEQGRQHMSAAVHRLGYRRTCRKVWCWNVLHELLDCDLWVSNQRAEAVHHFSKVVRRDVGSNPHCDAGSPIHQEVRYSRWEHGGLFLHVRHHSSAADPVFMRSNSWQEAVCGDVEPEIRQNYWSCLPCQSLGLRGASLT